MNPWLELFAAAAHSPRLLIGVMSGTSADGVDAALIRFTDDAPPEVRAFVSVPFPDDLRARVLRVASNEPVSAETVSRLGVELATRYADAASAVRDAARLAPGETVLAIGCHGQTVSHTPHGAFPATLQIGDPATLAHRTGLPVVSDFRAADVALGGQGAPLVPLADGRLFTHPTRSRAVQNIGGIGNVTFLPAGGGVGDIRGFDTGPGNVLMDIAAGWATGGALAYDRDGALAAQGEVVPALLDYLLAHPFLSLPPPKSAGREEFGESLWRALQAQPAFAAAPPASILATVTAFTAQTIADAYRRFLPAAPDEVIVAGGGARNPALLRALRQKLAPIPVRTSGELGTDTQAREALAFAVLADETLRGCPANLPAVTGATRPAVCGSVTLPPEQATPGAR